MEGRAARCRWMEKLTLQSLPFILFRCRLSRLYQCHPLHSFALGTTTSRVQITRAQTTRPFPQTTGRHLTHSVLSVH